MPSRHSRAIRVLVAQTLPATAHPCNHGAAGAESVYQRPQQDNEQSPRHKANLTVNIFKVRRVSKDKAATVVAV